MKKYRLSYASWGQPKSVVKGQIGRTATDLDKQYPLYRSKRDLIPIFLTLIGKSGRHHQLNKKDVLNFFIFFRDLILAFWFFFINYSGLYDLHIWYFTTNWVPCWCTELYDLNGSLPQIEYAWWWEVRKLLWSTKSVMCVKRSTQFVVKYPWDVNFGTHGYNHRS